MKNKIHKIYLGLGANVGDKKKNILQAINLLKEKIDYVEVAPIYETKPWGYKIQDSFLNTAICGVTSLSASVLLKIVKSIEKKIGRIERFRWGPREIDIDILFYDDLIYKNSVLEIPKRNLQKRDFVLKPLMELDPNIIHPVFKKKISQLYEELPKEERSIVRTVPL